MDLVSLLIKNKAQFEQLFPNISIVFTSVLLTLLISATIGILLAIIIFLKTKNILESFYLFIYSFLGCLSGGILGSVFGAFLGTILAVITFARDELMGSLSGIGIAYTLINAIAICWVLGMLIGSAITAKPLIDSFNNK